MFKDRMEAGIRLAAVLRGKLDEDALVLGIPRGGVIVAAEVARELGSGLDVLVVRKIGAPGNPEYAIAAVDEDGRIIGGGMGASAEYLERAAEVGREEIARRLALYRAGRAPARVRAREVVLVDDGIATGLTLLAALESLRSRGASRVVVAAPVGSPDSVERISSAADEVVVLETPAGFSAVGQFYSDFTQTSDSEVIAALRGVWR